VENHERKPLPAWLAVVGIVAMVADIVFTALAVFWHLLFWLPAIAITMVVSYLFIVVRGSAREFRGRP
jgi:hypothetical protein